VLIRRPALRRIRTTMVIGSLLVCFVLLLKPLAGSERHEMPEMARMPGLNLLDMQGATIPEDDATAVKRLADKRESEFNHHMAGLFVVLAGIFVLGEERLANRWSFLHYAWPACFLAAGFYLLVFSDTEIWPFGPQTPWHAVTHNPEDLQHKIFSVILLALGYVELQRVRGRYKGAWTAWFFPAVAMTGAILLLFHEHGGDMEAPNAMETMNHIQHEHFWFASVGFGIALTNGLAEVGSKWTRIYKNTWPTLLIVLGFLLMFYTE
jgi:copper resistance protein D